MSHRPGYYEDYYKANLNKIEARREANKEKHRKYTKEYYRKNREKALDSLLQKKYGITTAQKNQMIEQQGKKCANSGCSRLPTAVDHNHSTGKVRGILCSQCNTAFGLLKESPETILGLFKYLGQHT